MSVMPPTFEYVPVAPFHATAIQYGVGATSVVTDDLRTAVIEAWGGDYIFGAVIDGAGYAVGCYNNGYCIGVSAVFEVISQLTVDHSASQAYDVMLAIEMFYRMNWPAA